jgi:hypothetical protein
MEESVSQDLGGRKGSFKRAMSPSIGNAGLAPPMQRLEAVQGHTDYLDN